MFIKIPPAFLKSIATNNKRIPRLYWRHNIVLQNFFWKRLKIIYKLTRKYLSSFNNCLDFGCGGGIFLPTLSNLYNTVDAIDIEIKEASHVIREYNLNNVFLEKIDILNSTLKTDYYESIYALDVLEHFKDLNYPVSQLYNSLNKNGYLFTSFPTENVYTVLLRKIFKIKKPEDHYHNCDDIERFLKNKGFVLISKKVIHPFVPIFVLGIWKKQNLK